MKPHIPFLDIKKINNCYSIEFHECLTKVLDSGIYILGNELHSFEAEYAEYSGTQYCVGVGSGLSALTIALKSMDVGPGDEVIVPSNTYIATWIAVSECGAKIVPVEPVLETYNIDPERIENAITSRTKAIIPVHLYGQAAEMKAIVDIAEKFGIWVIEDNAQAHGAYYNNRKTGNWGHINATSFYPGKNLGALGDGGAITTNIEHLAEKVRLYRNYGSKVKYYNEFIGTNSRLDELQAAFLRIKLKHLDEANSKKISIANKYNDLIRGSRWVIPEIAMGCTHVYHQYVVRSSKRDKDIIKLNENNIGVMIHYPIPPHQQKAYNNLNYSFPISEKIHSEVFSLPIYPDLNFEAVEDAVKKCLNE